MEFFSKLVSFLFLILLFIIPIIIWYHINKRKIKYKFIVYLFTGIISTLLLALVLAWWVDFSNHLLLAYYNYDLEVVNEANSLNNVLPENIERVKSLQMSLMGIGWPLKALISYVFYSPYIFLVYLVGVFLQKKYLTINSKSVSD